MNGWASLGCAISIGFYEVDIAVTDVVYEVVNGVETQTTRPSKRTVRGAIDPSGSFKLRQVFGESWNDGDIAIFTTSDNVFKILQTYNPYSYAVVRKQSFIMYQGWQYRVMDKSDWVLQASLYVWRAARHATQDLT